MLFGIIAFITSVTFIFVLYIVINILNEKRRLKDPVFDKYLTKNNIRTRFDEEWTKTAIQQTLINFLKTWYNEPDTAW